MGHELRVSGTFLYDCTAPFADIAVPLQRDWSLASGSTSGTANKVFVGDVTLAAAATRDINLAQIVGPAGEFTPDYVAAFAIWCVTPAGKGTLTPHATNGWTGLGSAYSIPVSTGPFCVASDEGIAITSTNKVMTLTNTGAASATYRITILFRDSA
jgi:hypothetical protein